MRPQPFVLLAVVAVLLGGAGPVFASPQPTPVCSFCGEQFADGAGPNVTVSESTVTVQVHENGSATWTVRNELSQGADAFREDPESLERAARGLTVDHYGVTKDPQFVDARLDGDTAVLVYRDGDVVERHAGLLVVEYLHDRGYEYLYYVNADSLTIRGPPETVVTNTPVGGAVDGRDATWTGQIGEGFYGNGRLDGAPYVVFGPDHSTGSELRTAAALALATWPIVERGLDRFVLWQTLGFTLALGTLAYGVRRTGRRPEAERLGVGLGAVGLLALVVPYVTHRTLSFVMGPALFALLLGVVVADGRFEDRLRDARGQATLAVGLLAAVYVGFLAIYTVGRAFEPPHLAALGDVLLSLPFALALPLGAAIDHAEGRRPLRWTLLAGLSFVGVPLALVDLARPPSGLAGGVTFTFLWVTAILGPVLLGPFVLLGRSLRTPGDRVPPQPGPEAVAADD